MTRIPHREVKLGVQDLAYKRGLVIPNTATLFRLIRSGIAVGEHEELILVTKEFLLKEDIKETYRGFAADCWRWRFCRTAVFISISLAIYRFQVLIAGQYPSLN